MAWYNNSIVKSVASNIPIISGVASLADSYNAPSKVANLLNNGTGQQVGNTDYRYSTPGYDASTRIITPDPNPVNRTNQSEPAQTGLSDADKALAAARARASSQINTINSLLGTVGAKRDAGINNLNESFAEQLRRVQEQKAATMQGYDDQSTRNIKDRTRGYEQVDNFANNSMNSLARLFQGANAGASSVARLLAPHLVGKSAGSRRAGVTETANENDTSIQNARINAQNEYGYTEQDLNNQRQSQERDFREAINNQEQDLLSKRLAYEQDAGLATDATQNEINQRMEQLNQLFGSFKPSYNMRATPTQAVNLNSYSVDPASFRLNQNAPAETRYYAPQLKRKQQLV